MATIKIKTKKQITAEEASKPPAINEQLLELQLYIAEMEYEKIIAGLGI